MEHITALNTPLGIITGRDAIFLDKIDFVNESELKLIGEFSGRYAKKKFEMHFSEIVYVTAVEIDFDTRECVESIAVIENSDKISQFKKRDAARKVNDHHKHYYIMTYDTVFEIICAKFELDIKQ